VKVPEGQLKREEVKCYLNGTGLLTVVGRRLPTAGGGTFGLGAQRRRRSVPVAFDPELGGRKASTLSFASTGGGGNKQKISIVQVNYIPF
jgi:hypothetical protein